MPHGDAIAAFLTANPTFDLARGNVDQQLAAQAAAGTAADPELRAALKATQRVFKLTGTHRQTAALLAASVHSAAQIAAIGRNQFVKRFTGDGTFTAAEAAAVFQRAHAAHVAATFLAGELRALSGAAMTAAVAPAAAAKLSLVSSDNPNLRNLFQATDQCVCDSCRDITSPSAYLVDVLEFLRHRTVVDTTAGPPVPSQTARDVLFARRPDLADIDLSCDNTNVPLPYVDVVCELLEEAVSPDPGFGYAGPVGAGAVPPVLLAALQAAGFPFTATAFIQEADLAGCLYARDARVVCKLTPAGPPDTWVVRRLRQTFAAAPELAAAPEYVNDAAYVALQGARTAFHLPFDLFYAETNAYFAQFGVARDDLMRALAVGSSPAPRDIAAQALGLSDAERSLIVTSDVANQAVYWNAGASDPATVIKVVGTFLTRTELEYADLEALLQLQFINPAAALFIQHLDSSCDTTKKIIAGLDAAALDRIHRFLRLQRQLAWPPAVLDQAIMAPRLGNGQLDDALIVHLAGLAGLQRRLALEIGVIVSYYGLIPADGPQSRYAQLFLNPAANGSVDPALQVAAVQANEALPSASQQHLADVAAPLAVALGITAADMTALSTAMAAPPHSDDVLSLANLALLYGQLSLARALGSTVRDFLSLAHLTGADPLASPAATLVFAAEYDRIHSAGMTPADLRFLLAFEAANLSSLTLADSMITATLTRIQSQLQAAYTASRSPFDPGLTADENKAALGDVVSRLPGVSQAQLSALQAIVDNTYAGAAPAHQVLADILGTVLDVATVTSINSLQSALATTPAAPPGPFEAARLALIEALTGAVSRYLYGTARDAAVVAAVAADLPVDAALGSILLGKAHLVISGQPRTLLAILGDDSLIDVAHILPAPPAINPAAFPDQWAALRLASQIARFAATLPLRTDDVGWLLDEAGALGWLQLERLPYQSGMTAIPLSAWDQLQDAVGLMRRYPPVINPGNPQDPFTMRAVFTLALPAGGAGPPLLDLLAAVTGWDRGVIGDLDARFGFSVGSPSPYLLPATYLRLEMAVIALRKLGLSVTDGASLITPLLGGAAPATLRLALKTRYTKQDWLGVLKQIYDPLRERKRDALVAFLLAANPGLTSSDDLFDYFLVDVEMCACQPTSRIVSAHGTVQLFVQRCLMAVEPTAVADVADDDGWTQWSWMSAYRVWQANREIFLNPENWISPPLRDDKSEQFRAMENALRQASLTDDAITSAATGYLEDVDDISFLEVVTMCYDERTYTMHVFARTKGGDPPTYYYRRFIEERSWTPWEKVNLDIKGNHVMAFLRNGRLHLAWPIFTAQANPNQTMTIPTSADQGHPAPRTEQAWQIQLAVSERRSDSWAPSRTSQEAMPWLFGYSDILPAEEEFRFVPLDLRNAGFSLLTTFEGSPGVATAALLGGFEVTGCKGYPVPFGERAIAELLFFPAFRDTRMTNERFAEISAGNNDLSIATVITRTWTQLLADTPDAFRVTYPQQIALIDFLLLLLLVVTGQAEHGTVTMAREGSAMAIPLGTFMPYFYEDGYRDYVLIPGFFGREENAAGAPPIRRTYSDVLRLVQRLVQLVRSYLQKLNQDPSHDLQAIIQEFLADPQWRELRTEILAYRQLTYGVEFDNFYHPLICPLRATLYGDGIGALMARQTQLQTTSFSFAASYSPASLVRTPYPAENIDFTATGSYASYNWELFFHLPFSIAVRFSQDQQFEKAMEWFHYIFNPTDATADTVPRKYWQTGWFYQTTQNDYVSERIDTIMNGIASDPTGASIQDLAFAVEQWRQNPFEPFLIARTRTVAFQLAVVMAYIDNLIAWGDSLFTQDTMESVNQATQLYILADKLLGSRPRTVPPLVTPPPETFAQLEAKVDLFGNALLDLENLIPDISGLPHGGAELPPGPLTLSSLYFCIPPNAKLLGRWDTVADRLSKIRHCQDITGVARTLALFAPPIDPGALVAALAQGLSVADVLAGLNAPLPQYRFSTMAQKAIELAQLAVSLGNDIL